MGYKLKAPFDVATGARGMTTGRFFRPRRGRRRVRGVVSRVACAAGFHLVEASGASRRGVEEERA